MTNTPRITRNSLHAGERARLEKIENSFRVHAAALHGDSLSPIMVDTLVNSLVGDPRVFHHLVTGGTEEINPDDAAVMRGFSRALIQGDDMAQRNLEFSSATRRAELESMFFASLKPGEALAMQRRGNDVLSRAKEAYISERLDERFA
ncbi:hypothetical protein EU803_16670 [Loktanella sp. IMCC34160]|nr:hypothetical protein EU803_16670 [Loktanella sp. IMCC34160]